MKKIFLTLAVLIMAICASAQKNQYFWYQGNLMLGNPIAQIDSVTFGNADTDSILIYLPRTIVKTVEVHDTVYITIHDTVCPNAIPEGAINGAFSVASDKKVRFSKGNLQYQASTDTWRFAENQYDYVGDANENISPTYDGWIDLFGWGTGNNPTNSSESDSDYSTFVDWGINAISNGGNEANLWRTLTKDEMVFLFELRENALQLFGCGTINGIEGVIILPDNWNASQNVSFVPGSDRGLIWDESFNYYNNDNQDNFTHNTYTIEDWIDMEALGAVFLPVAGRRLGSGVSSSTGEYWSATTDAPFHLGFQNICLGAQFNDIDFANGLSVRLVQDATE